MKEHGSFYAKPGKRAAEKKWVTKKKIKEDKKEKETQPKSKAKKETKVGDKRTHR